MLGMQTITHLETHTDERRSDLTELERRQREQLHKEGRCSHSRDLGFCAAEGWTFDPDVGWRCLEHAAS